LGESALGPHEGGMRDGGGRMARPPGTYNRGRGESAPPRQEGARCDD